MAFRELYARFAQPTFRFLLRLAGGRDRAEDLHQETWLSVAQNVERLAPDSDLAAWIFTIARNKWRSAGRRSPFGDLGAAIAVTASWEDPMCRDLERALAALPEAQREVLLLVGIEGLDPRQAAEVLGLRPDALRQRLSRARAALADTLGAPSVDRRGVS